MNNEMMLHQLTVLLPGFDDGHWQNVSVVTHKGLSVQLEHCDFSDITLVSEMWGHENDVNEVLRQFGVYIHRLRVRAEMANR